MFLETVQGMVAFLFVNGYMAWLAHLMVQAMKEIKDATGYMAVVWFLGVLLSLSIILFIAYLFAGIMLGGC